MADGTVEAANPLGPQGPRAKHGLSCMASRIVHLEVLEVAEPCTEDWNAMRGDDLNRFCRTCHHNVYDLSAMTREAAEQLVSEAEGRLCIRFYRRADGTVTTVDCAPDRMAAMRRTAKKSLALAGAALAGLLTIVGGLGVTSLVFAGTWIEDATTYDGIDIYPVMGAMEPPMPFEPPPPLDNEDEVETDEEIENVDGAY